MVLLSRKSIFQHDEFWKRSLAYILLRRSDKLYKLQFKKWDWQKNLPASHSRFMVAKSNKRRREENKETVFLYGSQQWDRSKFTTLVRTGKNETAMQAEGMFSVKTRTFYRVNPAYADHPTPVGVSYKTPKQTAPTPPHHLLSGDESGADLAVDVSEGEGNNIAGYARDAPEDSSDAETLSDSSEDQNHDQLEVEVPLLSHQGLAQSELLSKIEMARSYYREGRMREAEDRYQQASQGLSGLLGPIHVDVNKVKYELANFYAENQQMQDADAIIDGMTRDHIERCGHSSAKTQRHILHTVELLETWNRSNDALGFLSHSKDLLENCSHQGRTRVARRHGVTQRRVNEPSNDIQAITMELEEVGSLATVNYGISLAKAHVKANDQATEGLLLAIIQHCERHPQDFALQHVQAMAERLRIYKRLGKVNVNESYFVSAEESLKRIWRDYDWDKERFQSIELIEASMQLALDVFRGGYEKYALRMFHRVDDKAKSLFGNDDERTIWILITIGLAYQSNASWDQASEWFEGAFAAALVSDRWDEEDGIVRALQNALDKRHFSYLSDEGRPYKSIFGVTGISIRPGRLHLS